MLEGILIVRLRAIYWWVDVCCALRRNQWQVGQHEDASTAGRRDIARFEFRRLVFELTDCESRARLQPYQTEISTRR